MHELRHDVERRIDLVERRLVAMRRLHHDVGDEDEEDAGDDEAEPDRAWNGLQRVARLIPKAVADSKPTRLKMATTTPRPRLDSGR